MNVVIYARVSSEKQADKDLSIKAQIKELECMQKPQIDCNDIFIDEAKSARTDNRPAFQAMISLASKKIHHLELYLYGNYPGLLETGKIQSI